MAHSHSEESVKNQGVRRMSPTHQVYLDSLLQLSLLCSALNEIEDSLACLDTGQHLKGRVNSSKWEWEGRGKESS